MLRFSLLLFLFLTACTSDKQLAPLPDINTSTLPDIATNQINTALAAIHQNPHNAEKNGHLGMILHSYGLYKNASILYQRALTLDSTNIRWHYFQAHALAESSELKASVSHLRRALEMQPEQLNIRLKLAQVLFQLGELDLSQQYYLAVSESNPEQIDAWLGVGKIYAREAQHKKAIQALKQALLIDPRIAPAYYQLALIYRGLGQPVAAARAVKSFQQYRAIQLIHSDPFLAEVAGLNLTDKYYISRAKQYIHQGQIAKAIAEYQKALVIEPTSLIAHITLAGLYGGQGAISKAEQHFKRAIELDENRAKAWFNIGLARLKVGKLEGAIRALKQASLLDPEDAIASTKLGFALERQGKIEDGIRAYKEAIQRNPGYREAHFLLGRRYFLQGHAEIAIQEFQQTLLPEDAHTPRFLGALAEAYLIDGQKAQAIAALQQAQQLAELSHNSRLLPSIQNRLAELQGTQNVK